MNAEATPEQAAPAIPAARARRALGVLLLINLINYLDRYVVAAVLPLIKAELHSTDAQLGALASAFMVVYMCAAVPIGYLADRFARKAWIVFGIGFWSLATFASGLAADYRQLFAARAAVGIGEACYGSISPSFVAEHFPPEKRSGALALFSMAIPVGSALGFVLGGMIGRAWGWREAFYAAGLPGLVLAWLAHRLRDPRDDGAAGGPSDSPARGAADLRDYSSMGRNRSLLLCTLAMASMTFSLGAFAIWIPTFYVRVWNLDVARANSLFGAVTVASGVAGSLIGGWISDRAYKTIHAAYFLVSGVGLLAAWPLSLAAIRADDLRLALGALFLAEFCAFLNMGPLNAVIVAVTPPRVRSMAFAANIFVIHALGDALSPTLVGLLSDHYGLRRALTNAAAGLGLAGLLCLWGARHYDGDARKAAAHA